MMERTDFPTRDLKVGVVISDIKPEDKTFNVNSVIKILSEIEKDTDLIVLTEMFSTGYVCDPSILDKIAEPTDGSTIRRLEEWARSNHISIWGTFICVEEDHYYNRGFMISGEGSETLFYDKRHLFRMGGEAEIYSPGLQESPIVNVKSWNLKMSICYDLRFPVWNRSRHLSYDCLIVPANWASSRSYAWHHLLKARAIENQVYAIGANRIGKDIYGSYNIEDIVIYDFMGKKITERTDSTPILYALLSAEKLNRYRSRFTPWYDADTFTINI